ncbi:MAG TPA: 3-isopropylmalate dehydrogenase [Nitrospinota bacterium]|nr:3-isopropylmalate dehydrogenase [Nitrospinota bacterium]|tara:strand:- start:174727 stop:175833 length:1107 start_codon:yes stop_codon:yes gene_type:complete
MTEKIAVFPGDGIGEEIAEEAIKILDVVNHKYGFSIEIEKALVGGVAYEKCGNPLPDDTLQLAIDSDAILLAAVGGPQWESLDYSVRPERALLGLRAKLDLFANLRPAKIDPALIDSSTLKREVVEGIDIMVVRELVGGIYFGEPKGVTKNKDGVEKGINTLVYTTPEIERIARVAFEMAQIRNKRVCSVDKANVLESTELWRRVVTEVHNDYKDVDLSHMYVDNCAMQLVRYPRQFDVIVTTNLFGDILSDEAAMLTGSIGMLPSASLGSEKHIRDNLDYGYKGMYEPVHGSAPDIADQNKANPIAIILSVAMMMKYTFGYPDAAKDIEDAIQNVLNGGYRTQDIYTKGMKQVGTKEMGQLIASSIK